MSRTPAPATVVPKATVAPSFELPGLMPKQRECYIAVWTYQRDHGGMSPSYNELVTALGLRSRSGVSRLLHGLQARGYARLYSYRSRHIELLVPEIARQAIFLATSEMFHELQQVLAGLDPKDPYKKTLGAKLIQWRALVLA